MSTQIVQLPRQAERAGPVGRLGRAVEQPAQAARAVQQLRFTAGQMQFQARFLQQHVEVGTATTGMVDSLRRSIAEIEQRLDRLVDQLGAQHVQLDELSEELTAVLDAVLDHGDRGDGFATMLGSGKTRTWSTAASPQRGWSA